MFAELGLYEEQVVGGAEMDGVAGWFQQRFESGAGGVVVALGADDFWGVGAVVDGAEDFEFHAFHVDAEKVREETGAVVHDHAADGDHGEVHDFGFTFEGAGGFHRHLGVEGVEAEILAEHKILLRGRSGLATDPGMQGNVVRPLLSERIDQQRVGLDVHAAAAACVEEGRVADGKGVVGTDVEVGGAFGIEEVEDVGEDEVVAVLGVGDGAEELVFDQADLFGLLN